MTRDGLCWCGGRVLDPIGEDYGRCRDCATVVYRVPYDPDEFDKVGEDGSGFYGDAYWLDHVPEVDELPGLRERARGDLAERTTFHLERILSWRAPSPRILELGCGHGGLTYLLSRSGREAEALEVGRPAVEIAAERFGLDVRRGALEQQSDLGRFGAVVAIDVLEHLPWPRRTLAACARHLEPGGLLFLQTPCYRGEGADWPMLIAREHLYLYDEASIRRLLGEEGFQVIEAIPSIFPDDMWVVAGEQAASAERQDPTEAMPPEIVALGDAARSRESTRLELEEARSDQAAKEELIRGLSSELDLVRADQSAKEALIARTGREFVDLHATLAEQNEQIEKLTRELAAMGGVRTAGEALVLSNEAELSALRVDQGLKGELIARLSRELAEVRADQEAKGELITRLSRELDEVRADQAAKEELIRKLSRRKRGG